MLYTNLFLFGVRMTHLKFYFIMIAASLLIIGCGEKKKKVHTQFDTVEIISESNDALNDSPKSGGPGFEKYASSDGWVTNNNINITGDPKAIKGDTITIVADDVFPQILGDLVKIPGLSLTVFLREWYMKI